MKTFYHTLLAICASLSLLSCQSKPDGTENTSSEVSTDTLKVIAVDTSVSTVTDFKQILNSLPEKWMKITNYEQEFVFIAHCDAETDQVWIQKPDKNQKEWQLMHLLGQDSDIFTIKNVQREEERTKDEIEVRYTFEVFDEMSKNTYNILLNYNGNNDSLAGWSLVQRGIFENKPLLYAPQIHYSKYPTLQSSLCIDCFDQCSDTEELLIGIGVITIGKVTDSKTKFYNTATAKNAPRTLIIDSNAEIKGTHKWIEGFQLYPDYDIFHLICVGKTDNRYEVVVSRSPYRTMWIEQAPDRILESWETYLASVLSIEIDSRIPQKILDQPQGNPIDMDSSCLQVVALDGDWAQVQATSPTCESNDNPQTGWIRWKENGNLLIQVFLVV